MKSKFHHFRTSFCRLSRIHPTNFKYNFNKADYKVMCLGDFVNCGRDFDRHLQLLSEFSNSSSMSTSKF